MTYSKQNIIKTIPEIKTTFKDSCKDKIKQSE